MADVQLDDLRQAGDFPRGVEIQAVTGVAFDPQPRRLDRAETEALEFRCGLVGLAHFDRMTPGAGMQFDDRRPDR